jgi:hypothetical protein
MTSPEPRGATIRIFLVDGTPQGVRLVDRIGWTGACLAFARADYGSARGRKELRNPGVYILTGPNPEGKRPQEIYIGEGDAVRVRIDMHHKEKDFWTNGYVLTAKDNSLNKAHVRYLESRLIAIARQADNATINNQTEPPCPWLVESEIADMEAYLDNALLLLPLVGVTAFEIVTTDSVTSSSGSGSPTHPDGKRYHLETQLTSAEAVDDPRGFTVLGGALARLETKEMTKGYRQLRSKLRDEGILVPHNDKQLRLSRNYVFDSPSSAASVLSGGSKNGRVVWKDASGLTLKQNQEATASSRSDTTQSPGGDADLFDFLRVDEPS